MKEMHHHRQSEVMKQKYRDRLRARLLKAMVKRGIKTS